jgi:hypothetical protein
MGVSYAMVTLSFMVARACGQHASRKNPKRRLRRLLSQAACRRLMFAAPSLETRHLIANFARKDERVTQHFAQ